MILHLDMDAFFAAVELLDNPALKGLPLIVGGGERGVVTTASYEARKFGIHSAMPMMTARKLCPGGIFVPCRFKRYSEVSAQIMACLRDYSPVIQKASIDEAYLAPGSEALSPDAALAWAYAIKEAVARVSGGLTCSIGIAPVKFLAKMCSDVNKPDGIFILAQEEVDNFLLPLPVEKLPGIGKSMQASLRRIGITTVRGLRNLSREFLCDRYGKWGLQLYERSHGIDRRTVHENDPPRSESSEKTFLTDIDNKKELELHLLEQAGRVAASLRKLGNAGRTITLKIKFSDFRQITRSRTLCERVCSAETIFNVACSLLNETFLPKSVRLAGICVSGFEARQEQLTLPGIAHRIQ